MSVYMDLIGCSNLFSYSYPDDSRKCCSDLGITSSGLLAWDWGPCHVSIVPKVFEDVRFEQIVVLCGNLLVSAYDV